MNKTEMLVIAAKVAEHYLNKGHTDKTFKKLTKADLIIDFPELLDLKEIPESNYDHYTNVYPEESTLNYFKSLAAFDIVYKMRTDPHRKN